MTNFGDPVSGSRGTPLAVLNDQLLFLAIENGKSGLYRTDGTNVALIDNVLTIPTSNNAFADVEVAQLGNELFLSAQGPSGRELYATDGQTLRLVADINPGLSNSTPKSFYQLNDQLLFNAAAPDANSNGVALSRSLHTDGSSVGAFATARIASWPFAHVNNRIVFPGTPPGGGVVRYYSTDGNEVALIDSDFASTSPIVAFENEAYYITGQAAGQRLYRTDGLTSHLVGSIADLASPNWQIGTFSLSDAMYLSIRNDNELVFYQTQGDQPSEVLRWTLPSSVRSVDVQPIFSNDDYAIFSIPNFIGELFLFDGNSVSQISNFNLGAFTQTTFTQLGDRVFVSVEQTGSPVGSYEIVNGTLEHLGTSLRQMAQFHGEVFGIGTPTTEGTKVFHVADGALTELGNRRVASQARFLEFDGKLYFNGSEGTNQQLYAIVPVPEPNSLVLLIASMLAFVVSRRQNYAPPNRR